MAKLKLEARDLADFIELFNPFGFKDEKGVIMTFKDYDAAYFELLQRLYQQGPTYIDCVLFCADNWGMNLVDGKRFVNTWNKACGVPGEVVLIDWKNGGAERDSILQRLAKSAHLLTETKFNLAMFLNALNRFKSLKQLN